MNSQYITKTELAERWSNKLIEKYFPQCSLERPNPQYKRGSPMQLYDVGKVRHIESTEAFKTDYQKACVRKVAARERAQRKREELIMYANGVQIKIPDMEKDKLIEKACYHYNIRHYIYGSLYDEKATPSSDESFLKRITINYLRHKCTTYDMELQRFYKKVGKHEAHDVLQERINEAIKQKYEWLR